MSPPVTRTINERRLMERVLELEEVVENLNLKVDGLNLKVSSLENEISDLKPLKKEVEKLNDCRAVATTVSENLSKEVERLQQYSRRNCIVLENIPLTKNESIQTLEGKVESAITKDFGIEKSEYKASFDKTHRIGPIREKKQRVIVRFTRHSMCEKIYQERKRTNKFKVKPSLTNFRLRTLNCVKERFSGCEKVEFIYADIHGNLKVRLREKHNERFVHQFENENELSDLIFDIENSVYEDNNNNLFH